jgi:hypothetical protein
VSKSGRGPSGETKPSGAMGVNPFMINEISLESGKRSHGGVRDSRFGTPRGRVARAAGVLDSGFLAWHKQQAFENKELKRNTIDISRVFYNISHSRANATFSVGPFIMLKIGGVWREDLLRFQSRNWDWRSGLSMIQTAFPSQAVCRRHMWSIPKLGDIGRRSRVRQDKKRRILGPWEGRFPSLRSVQNDRAESDGDNPRTRQS